jgi:hypothetical protein
LLCDAQAESGAAHQSNARTLQGAELELIRMRFQVGTIIE